MSNSLQPMDHILPGSPVHGLFQARILEWFAISFSRRSPDPGIEPGSPALQVDSLPLSQQRSPVSTHYRENTPLQSIARGPPWYSSG